MSLITKGLSIEKRERPKGHDSAAVTLEPPADNPVSTPQQVYTMPEAAPVTQQNPLFEQPRLDNSSAFINYSSTFQGQAIGNRNILVTTPNTNQDVTNIVMNLQNNEACVINLENIPTADAQRRLDFLSGVICAMNGSIKPLDAYKYILTPQGMGVQSR